MFSFSFFPDDLAALALPRVEPQQDRKEEAPSSQLLALTFGSSRLMTMTLP